MSTQGRAQFTPGPWNAYNVHKGRILKHWQVDTGTGKVMLDDAAQWEAGNATIIAAAPAMYEALRQAYAYLAEMGCDCEEGQSCGDCIVCQCEAALAQAEGRQA